jgi:hypothetical protein
MDLTSISGSGNLNITYGKTLNYSISKTSDPFILNNDPFLRSLEITNQSDDLSLMTKEYIIANKDDKNFYFSKGLDVEQSQLANDTVSIQGYLVRPTGGNNIWSNSFINSYLPRLKSGVLQNISQIGSDYIINGASLNYDSNLSYGMNLSIASVKPK